MAPNPGKQISIVGNGEPINAVGVTKYSGFQDACVRCFFLVLPFRIIVKIQIGLS